MKTEININTLLIVVLGAWIAILTFRSVPVGEDTLRQSRDSIALLKKQVDSGLVVYQTYLTAVELLHAQNDSLIRAKDSAHQAQLIVALQYFTAKKETVVNRQQFVKQPPDSILRYILNAANQ